MWGIKLRRHWGLGEDEFGEDRLGEETELKDVEPLPKDGLLAVTCTLSHVKYLHKASMLSCNKPLILTVSDWTGSAEWLENNPIITASGVRRVPKGNEYPYLFRLPQPDENFLFTTSRAKIHQLIRASGLITLTASPACAMKASNILFAPIRAQFFFLRVPNFVDFLNLCVISHPSPLDDNAPWTSQLILLLIGGSVEYMGLCFLSDLLDVNRQVYGFFIRMVRQGWSNVKWQRDKNPDRVYHFILATLFAICFWVRLKALVRRQALGKLRRNFVLTFLSLNPALVWHGFLVAAMQPVKLDSSRIRVLKFLWGFMAPAVDVPFITSSFFISREGDEFLKEIKANLEDTGFGSIAYKSAKIVIAEMILKRIPWVLILLALDAQSQVYLRRGRVADPNKGWKWLSKLARFGRVYHTVESILASVLIAVMGRFATIITAVLRHSLGPLLDRRAAKPAHRKNSPSSSARIRLLYLLPSLSESDPISCTMKWHNVSSLPSYTAVSYAWGSNDFTHQIVVNDETATDPVKKIRAEPVTLSAHEVLTNLRSRWRTRILWIDAICISQSDSSDKAEQIPLMPTIYERANRTVVWLGPAKTAALAIELVSRLFLINRLSVAWKSPLSYEIDPVAARSLLRMLERPWFTRTWVVQEVVRAKDVSILYGRERLSWEVLSWFMQAVQRDKSLLQMLDERAAGGQAKFGNLVAMQNMTIMRRFSMLRSHDQPLSLLFYMVQMFRTVEARFDSKFMEDRVYALLGLSGANTDSITPEYEKGLRQVYIDVARHFGTTGPESRRLEFLLHAGMGYKPVTKDLPTWVPDWAITPQTRPLPGTDGTAEMLFASSTDALLKDAAGLAVKGTYIVGDDDQEEVALARTKAVRDQMVASLPNCTSGTTPNLVFHPDNDTLTVRGRKLSRIRSVGLMYPGSGDNLTTATRVLSGWAVLASSVARRTNPYGTQNVPDFFMQTLLNNGNDPSFDYTFTSGPVGRVNVDGQTKLGEMLLFVHLAKLTLSATPAGVVDPAIIRAIQDLVGRADRFCIGKVFAVTDSGHFGLFMQGTQEGDVVCLLDGLSLPVSLREAKTESVHLADGDDVVAPCQYELVGPAYIRGELNGEGPEDFVIR